MKSSRLSPFLVVLTWLFVLALLLPDVALAAGYLPNAPASPAAPFSPWDTFAQDGPTTVEELAREAMETPLDSTGRLLFAPTIDSDGNPATNPVAGTVVPVIDLMGDKGGFVFLAAQLMPDDPEHAPIGLPVTFHIWNDRGYDYREAARSDAWGAAGLRLLPRDIEATYSYQASAPGYGQTEVRSFRFNPAEASYILHADGAELWHWQGAERTVFTVRSPRPLVEGRDSPMLVIARRPQLSLSNVNSAGAEAEAFAQVYQALNSQGAGIPLPTLPMHIVDEYTAQVEVQLPAGSYGAIASLAIEGQPAEHFYSEPLLLAVEEEPAAPDGIAIWASGLEYEPGRTLVQYQAERGTAVFALLPTDNLPPISPAWLEESTFLRTWRTGPFEWQEEVYNVSMDILVDDGLKKVSLAGFDYDPMLRRYTIAIESLQDRVVTDTLRVDVYGPGGVVIHHIDAQVVLKPDELLIYEIDVPAELGKPTGLRVLLDDPIDAIINAISAAGQSLADLVRHHGNFQLTFSFFVDALGVKILEIKMVMTIPPGTIEVSDPLDWWFPDGSDAWTLLDKIKDWALNGAWDWDNMILDIGGATWEMKLSLGLSFTVDDGACPDEESRDDMARALSNLANIINVGFEGLKDDTAPNDPSNENGITVPLFWFLQLFARLPDPAFTGVANADGLTLRISVDFNVSIALRLAVDLWPFNIPHFEDSIKGLYHGVLLLQGIYQIFSKNAELKNWQLRQANCNPDNPDGLPPDDRQDVWQSLDRLYRGDTPEQSLEQLNQWLASAGNQNLDRAALYVKLQMRRTELFAFSSDTAAFDAYIGQVATIAEAASVDQQAIVSGTLSIAPGQTITEAVLTRGEQAYLEMEGLPYVQQQRQLMDAVSVAERDFNELFGEELELQHELQQMLFGNSAGIVASGFTYATEATLATAGLPYQYVSLWPGGDGQYQGQFAPYVAPEIAPRLLVVPSGGLHAIANSPAATAWLDEYVATGGLLVVFTQAFGEDWNALPGGEVRGVGYNEDQRCQQASVRAAMPSDWLVWMGVPYPDIQVDGAFTAWPANTNVLLVRTYGNFPNYPAMIEYEYGSGRVLATTAYGDWAESTGIGWGDDWQLTRTILLRAYLLSQGQDIDDVTAVPPYTWYNPTITLTNSSALTATEVLVRLPTFTGKASAYGGDTVTATLALGPGQTTVISPSLRTPTVRRNIHDWTRIGLYRLRVNTTTADGLVHKGWGPFLLVTGGTPPPEMNVLLTASQVAANPFDLVTITATIRNFTAVPRSVTLLAQGDLAGEAPFVTTLAPGGSAQHTYQLAVHSSLEPAVALQDNNSSELIDESRMLIHLARPSAQIGLSLPPVVESGTPLAVSILNEPVYQWQQAAKIVSGTVELELYGPNNGLRWSQSQALPIMGPGEVYTATFTAASPAPVALGYYRFDYRVRDYTGRVVGSGSTLLPATVAISGVFDQSSYRIRETVTFTGTIINSGGLDLAPTVEMTMPPLANETYSAVNLPVGGSAELPLSFTLPPTMTAGIYTVTVTASQNSIPGLRRFTFTVPPAHVTAELLDGVYTAGGSLPIRLTNSGGLDATTDYQLWLTDNNGVTIASQSVSAVPIQAGEAITVLLPIPAGAASSVYRLLLTGQTPNANQDYHLLRLPAISGVEVAVTVATDQFNYTAGDDVNVSGEVTAVQSTVSGTLALTVRQAGLGNVETATAGSQPVVVNDNDEPGFLDQDGVDVLMDDDGNVYAIWDRFGTGDIAFNMKPAGGSWGTPEAVNDSRYYGRDDPELALGSDGTLYAIWWDNRDLDYEGTSIYYAERSPAGVWTANEQVNEFPGWEYAYDPDIAVDAAGNLYAVYYDDREGNDTDIIFAMKPAGGDWTTGLPVTDASAGGFPLNPSIVVDAAGNAHLIWHDDRSYPLYELYYAYRPAGGSWGTPEKINTAGNASQYDSEIVLLPTGEPAVVWQDNRSGNYDIYFAYRPTGGPWSANEQVSDANTAVQEWPDMGVDAAGNVYVAWLDRRGGGYHVYSDWRSPAGVWAGDTLVTNDSAAAKEQLALAVNNSGAAYAAWGDRRAPTGTSNNGEIYGAARPAAGSWGANERVSTGGGGARQQVPALTYDSNNRPIILWTDTRLNFSRPEIYFDVRGSHWQTDARVNDDAATAFVHGVPAVTADGSGNAYAVWQDGRGGTQDIYFSIYNGTTWSANSRVNNITTGSQTQPAIAVTAAGDAYALWADQRSGNFDIYFSFRPAGGAWSASVKVNNDVGTTAQLAPDIALDAAGNAYAVWHDARNGNNDIYFSYRPAGGSWGANQRINDDLVTTIQSEPALFVTSAGDAYVTWTDRRNGPEEIYFALRPAGGSWTLNEKLPLGTIATSGRWSDLVVDADGNVFVVWSHFSTPRNVYLSIRQGSTWAAPIQLSNGLGDTAVPVIAISPSGEIGVAFEDDGLWLEQDIHFTSLTTGLRPLAGPWSAPEQRVEDDAPAASWQWNPDLAIDGLGNRYVAWSDDRNGTSEVWFAWQSPGAAWSANEPIGHGSSGMQFDPAVAVDPYGNGFAVWSDMRGGNGDVYFAYRPVTGTWGVNERINDDSGTTHQWIPDILVDAAGNAYATWQDQRSGNGDIYYSFRPASGSWSPNVKVNDDTGGFSQSDPNLALDPAGNIYAIWDDTRNSSGSNQWDIYFASKTANGIWGPNERVSDDNSGAQQWYPRLVVDAAGNAYATWMDERGGDWNIYFAYRPAGGSWSANQRINDDAGTAEQIMPAMVIDAAGYVTIAWTDFREGAWHIYAVRRAPNGQWSRNLRVNSNGTADGDYYRLGLAAHSSGDVTAVWSDYRNGSAHDLYSATMDIGPETTLWQEEFAINTSTSQTANSNAGTLYERPGKYWLVGELTSALDQHLGEARTPFYIYPAGLAFTLDLSDPIIASGQSVTATGRITNTSLLADTFQLSLYAGTEQVHSQSFNLSAGQGVAYSVNFSPDTSLPVQAIVNGTAVSDWLDVVEPQVTAVLTSPLVAGVEPITATVTMTNTGLVPAAVNVAIGSNPAQPVTLDPGEVTLVQQALTIDGDTVVSAVLTGDANQTLTRTIPFGAGATLTWQLPADPLAGSLDVSYLISGTGSLPTPLQLLVSLDGSATLTRSLTVLPGQTLSGTVTLSATTGAHLLNGQLVGISGQSLHEEQAALGVASAGQPTEAQITILDVTVSTGGGNESLRDPSTPIPAGQPFDVTVTVRNDAPAAPIIVAVQLFNDVQQWVITPTAYLSQSYTFSQSTPADIPAGEYIGRLVAGNAEHSFTVAVSGADVELALTLDQPDYLAGQVVSLTATLTEQAGAAGQYRLALHTPSDEDYVTVTVLANTAVQHTFTFTATEGGRASVALSYAGGGPADGQRTIMIDSLPLQVADPAQKARISFDQYIYEAGDTIWFDVTVNDVLGNLAVIGPMELFRDNTLFDWNAPKDESAFAILTGTHSLSYTLPADLRTGAYTFLLLADGRTYPYAVDVHGWSVNSLHASLDHLHYEQSDTLAATVEFLNNGPTAINGLHLRAWVAPADGSDLLEFTPAVSRTVSLQPGLNVFTVTGAFDSPAAGPHRLLVNLMAPDWSWRVAGAVAQFDVGAAYPVELATDHGSYTLNQAGNGRLTLYGYGPTQVVVTATNGATLLNTTVELTGFESLTFAVPTDNYGDYLLLANVTGDDGSQGQLVRAYNVPIPRDTTAPLLTLTDPVTRTVITGTIPAAITISGQASDDSGALTLLVNGEIVTPTVGGLFTATLPLTRGINLLSAVALDAAGNVTFSPLLPVYLVPDTEAAMSAAADPVVLNTSLTFNVVLTSSDQAEQVLYSQLLPTNQITNVTVTATSGTAVVSHWYSGTHTINWSGVLSPTQPVTLQITGRPIMTGTITGTATLFWGWGMIEDTTPITVEVLDSDPTAVRLGQIVAHPLGRPNLFVWPVLALLLLVLTVFFIGRRRYLRW
jgi:hypothetical protein